MARDQVAFRPANPWPRIGWLALAAILAVSLVLGFLVLDRYRQNDPTLSMWSAICRGLGITADIGPAREPEPPLRTPSLIAWTSGTLDKIRRGNAQHGSNIAMTCAACHGDGGVNTSTLFPTLAGMDAAVIYKQLDDFRSGKRVSDVMSPMAKALSDEDSADVAAYFASRPGGLTAGGNGRPPQHEHGESKESGTATSLVFVGDQQRGIPPCAACHGPDGYKLGAPLLAGQHAAYIEGQLTAFAQSTRQNDINEQMRTVAKQLTPDEMHMLGAFWQSDARSAAK